jgi:2,4-dienoyl-CoA reductase-like NADH-dependent reductase (Old Yellow Enzyme family)
VDQFILSIHPLTQGIDMNSLYENTRLGRYTLRNRLVMAPMTRSHADDATGVPSALAEQYYAQRADAGLIVTEGTFPSPMGKGYVRTPGIHSAAQIEAWKRITAAVHAKGGLIFLQLMHTGRISHPSMLPGHAMPVAPSAIAAEGEVFTTTGPQDFVVPRALETEEFAGIVAECLLATRHALEAGFDGVELHAASGYLPEQFLSSGTNQRTDRYGGSLANRTRFVLDALTVMTEEAGNDRVGIKIAPEMGFNSVSDVNPQETISTSSSVSRSSSWLTCTSSAPGVHSITAPSCGFCLTAHSSPAAASSRPVPWRSSQTAQPKRPHSAVSTSPTRICRNDSWRTCRSTRPRATRSIRPL